MHMICAPDARDLAFSKSLISSFNLWEKTNLIGSYVTADLG